MSEKNVIEFKNDKSSNKKRKRRLRRIVSLSGTLLILSSLISAVIYFSSSLSRLDMIYFEGLEYVSRSDIITLANLREQPHLISIDEASLVTQILMHPLIEDVNVSKQDGNDLLIEITEKEVLGCVVNGDVFEYVLSDGSLVNVEAFSNKVCQGIIIDGIDTQADATTFQIFMNELMKVEGGFIYSIQEINYEPDLGDVNRFSLYLKDGNIVKVNSFTMVDKLQYLETMKQTVNEMQGEVTGTYHLDVGDYFKPHDSNVEEETDNLGSED